MKPKYLVCLLLCTSLCITIGCTNNIHPTATINNASTPSLSSTQNILKTEGDIVSNCTLIVNGIDITSEHYVKINEDYAELPFIAIMDTLGAEIVWQNENTANITYNSKNYILKTNDCSFMEVGGQVNFLSTPPGGTRHYKTVEGEFILDSVTTSGAFQLMKANTKININYTDKVITIKNN